MFQIIITLLLNAGDIHLSIWSVDLFIYFVSRCHFCQMHSKQFTISNAKPKPNRMKNRMLKQQNFLRLLVVSLKSWWHIFNCLERSVLTWKLQDINIVNKTNFPDQVFSCPFLKARGPFKQPPGKQGSLCPSWILAYLASAVAALFIYDAFKVILTDNESAQYLWSIGGHTAALSGKHQHETKKSVIAVIYLFIQLILCLARPKHGNRMTHTGVPLFQEPRRSKVSSYQIWLPLGERKNCHLLMPLYCLFTLQI